MPNGVVSWPVYEGFQIGEKESSGAYNAFETFIPIGAASTARKNIIFDFYDLVAAVAAHGKMNGLGGRKLSRLAGWWAFEHSDDGKGFEGGYKSWTAAADASSHLFFAYLRSLAPQDSNMTLIERIPRSLQALLASTEYPPQTPSLLQKSTPRVVMLVDAVSPTPFALLRRAKHFEFRDRDRILKQYAEFEDPVEALTEECKRVLYAISTTNSSAARSRHGNVTKTDESWSAFQNLGFADMDEKALPKAPNGTASKPSTGGLRSEPRSRNADHGRPTTPSWADFLSSGFAEDGTNKTSASLLLPPDKQLPLLGSRAQTPSYIPGENEEHVAPGELAAITDVELDDAFWWVWMISLAGEEPAERKAVFGRCALIETTIMHGKWLIMEEQVKGASPDLTEGVYLAPKKSFFSTFTKRGKLGRKRSTTKKPPAPDQDALQRVTSATPSKSSLAPDQTSKIRQAAAALKKQDSNRDDESTLRRGRHDDAYSTKTNSMLTMGLQSEAGPAMKWTSVYDKSTVRAQYLGDSFAGRGVSRENLLLSKASSVNVNGDGASSVATPAPALSPGGMKFPTDSTRELPALPKEEPTAAGAETTKATQHIPPATMPPPASITVLPADAKEKQKEAENVPLPEAAPLEKVPSAMDKEIGAETPGAPRRKPVPAADINRAHPAFRQQSVDTAAARAAPVPSAAPPQSPQSPTSPTKTTAVIAAQKAMEPKNERSPESQKSGHSKLKKQSGGGGGLKKLFGRKKDNPNRQSMNVVNATNDGGLAPPAENNLGRRLSQMRKKPVKEAPTPKDSQVDIREPPAHELEAEPVLPESHGQFEPSATNVSHIDLDDRENAEKEFSRFDQGPLEDMPGVTPRSSQHEIAAPQAQRKYNAPLAEHITPANETENYATTTPAFATPMERSNPADDQDEHDEVQSEASMEDQKEPEDLADAKDRWAQIRENAAKRAARASEEQSTQSRPSQSQRTDDGETSEEESKFSSFFF